MEQKDLNKKIQELESKLEEATRPKPIWFIRLIKKTSFVQGFIFSVLMTSAVGIAFTLPGSPFVAGNVISAADVNAKFTAIEAKLSELDIGFMATMSAPKSVACGASAMGAFAVLPFDTTSRNDGSFITGSFHYSVPANAYYRILTQVPFPSYGGMTDFKITKNGAN
ncbi:MAG: hypothetical protein KC493_13025, partial [Bacteriovoracaceae bacterium]|nr:hypothetical protein [Bacteriovoracaceae bacterium]